MTASAAESAPQSRIHAGEWRAVLLSFVYFFCVLAAYYMLRPVREQLSAVAGSTQLLWFYAATFVATLVLTPLFAALVARYRRPVVVPGVYGFFIACLIAFVPFFAYEGLLSPRMLAAVFFVWVSVFNLFVVAVFWSFMADIWEESQARRLFPIIAVAGSAGAIAGPIFTRMLVGYIGVAPLLWVSAGLMTSALICAVLLGRWARVFGARRHERGHEAALGGGMWDGLRQIFADPFMRSMSLLLLLSDGIGTVNYALVADYAGATFHDAVARTRFFSGLDLVTNVLQVVLQLTLTRWLLPRLGAGVVLQAWAGGAVAVLLMVAWASDPYGAVSGMAPPQVVAALVRLEGEGWMVGLLRSVMELILTMPWVALALVVSRGLAFGVANPARESLFAQVPRSLRYKGKNAVDTAVWRFGDMSIALCMNALRAVGTGVLGFSLIAAASAATAGALGWRLWRRANLVSSSTREAAARA